MQLPLSLAGFQGTAETVADSGYSLNPLRFHLRWHIPLYRFPEPAWEGRWRSVLEQRPEGPVRYDRHAATRRGPHTAAGSLDNCQGRLLLVDLLAELVTRWGDVIAPQPHNVITQV